MKEFKKGVKRKISGTPTLAKRRRNYLDITSIPPTKEEQINNLITCRELDKIKELFNNGACVNWRDKMFNGYSYLHFANSINNLDVLNLLFTYPDLDPNVTDVNGHTALWNVRSVEIACLFLRHPKFILNKEDSKCLNTRFFSDANNNLGAYKCALPHKVKELLCFLGDIRLVCKNFNWLESAANLIPDAIGRIVAQGTGASPALSELVEKSYKERIDTGISLKRIHALILADILESWDPNAKLNIENGL
ncbi:MAG: hypothetical protein K0R73_75 [Candidatus Midichloriaceae bacterium]|jgi:hypothetical protein|nr:hypothetical protein [Candidatus Midichloriaceae bacterium]